MTIFSNLPPTTYVEVIFLGEDGYALVERNLSDNVSVAYSLLGRELPDDLKGFEGGKHTLNDLPDKYQIILFTSRAANAPSAQKRPGRR